MLLYNLEYASSQPVILNSHLLKCGMRAEYRAEGSSCGDAETAYGEDQIADSWKKGICALCVRYRGVRHRYCFLPQQLYTMIFVVLLCLRQAATAEDSLGTLKHGELSMSAC